MRNLILISTIIFLYGTLPSFSQTDLTKNEGLEWHTDAIKAQELSKNSHKPIFAFFTGSDWCGWCHKLQNDVFSKPEFIAWAKKNVILLELDFPKRKQLAPELAQQNASLQQTFQVRGYPTIWLYYSIKDKTENKFNITALGTLGYPAGAEVGKEEQLFISNANKLLTKDKGN